jgi:hypothetical protein
MTQVLFYRAKGIEAEVARVTEHLTPDIVNLQLNSNADVFTEVPRYKKSFTKKGTIKLPIFPFFKDFMDEALGFNN